MKVKIFAHSGDAPSLENDINEWLKKNDYMEIFEVKQSCFFDESTKKIDTVISVWFT